MTGRSTGSPRSCQPAVFKALDLLRDELPTIDVTVSSDYSPDLADALARGRLDLAFLRAEPGFDLDYATVDHEPLVVLMPSDHPLAARDSIRPVELVGQPFVAMVNKARALRDVVDGYLAREGVELTPTQGVDNPAMVMSLVASTRGLALTPKYVEGLLPSSVVSRPLAATRRRSTWSWATAAATRPRSSSCSCRVSTS